MSATTALQDKNRSCKRLLIWYDVSRASCGSHNLPFFFLRGPAPDRPGFQPTENSTFDRTGSSSLAAVLRPLPFFLRRLYREGRLIAAELTGRLRALDALASGKLPPPLS